jgi:hypothetical protein
MILLILMKRAITPIPYGTSKQSLFATCLMMSAMTFWEAWV